MTLREALVNLDAVRRNVEVLRRGAGGATAMAVVKADGYGHGALPVARAALEAGAEWIGTADLAEALALRAAGITAPLLCWLHPGDVDMRAAVEADIDLGISTADQLERAGDAGATVHLKTDTGLSRNGIPESELPAVLDRAAALESAGRLSVRGIFSHLANASDDDDREQLAAFHRHLDAARAAGLAPEAVHFASTAAAIRHEDCRFGMVRLGIGMYGLSPFDGVSSAELGLTPAMTLSAEVVSVKRVPAGSGVSYGFTYRTAGDTTLALVAMGYADGVPRQASNRGPVTIGGVTHTVSGRIAMDQFVVDVGNTPVQAGDRAVLFGDPADGVPSADDWALAADTINYEIVTRVGPRVPRRYRG
ncbi:alanine racemase [Diaminobutyricimonas aerilata]|uniref:Alanine racemase n=1 Tax=Diaminobutyricimonas aerilata TaxID=1162967 RepID=A0A2M9CMS9_9MICO|nr:alanine racemase [Diaminobutyricimonas aerilata]PJJ73182.1 alanine racemase [Diaminobutyricimonas aerilata]